MMNNNVTTQPEISSNTELKNKIDAIPDKMGFKIGEVAEFVGVKQYVLRYWETEFEALHPRKSHNGQRFYTRKDIEMALLIRKLLHEDRFSIEGARAVLKKMKQAAKQSQISAADVTPEPVQARAEIPLAEDATEEQVLNSYQPAEELVLNKAVMPNQQTAAAASVEQVEKALAQREKELHQYWASSLDYLLEEIRSSRRRLIES